MKAIAVWIKSPLVYFILFCLFSMLAFAVLSYEKDEKIEQHLQSRTTQYLQNYNVFYKKNQTISNIIFSTEINTDEVVDIFKDAAKGTTESKDKAREKLYNHLKETYSKLKEYNIKQLHFHTPQNESFLRFHRPLTYGDNLTDIRATIAYVNRTKKPIDGFEEGRIYNGYRFVFPMFYKDEHIGSVEISFNTFSMNLDFMQNYNRVSNFLVLKSVVDKKLFKDEKRNYTDSVFEDFYIEKKMLEILESMKKIDFLHHLSKNTIDAINKRGQDSDSFSLYDSNIKEIVTFVKVKNPVDKKVIGVLVVKSPADYIQNKTKNFYLLFGLVSLFIILVLYVFYKEIRYRIHIENSNVKLKESKQFILSLNKTLQEKINSEVEKSRKKDKYMFQQSRMAQMGELISMIAHQWRQPLSAISATCIDMRIQIDLETFDMSKKEDVKLCQDYTMKNLDNIDTFVHGLSATIDDFRNFYKPNKEYSKTPIRVPIETALKIIQPTISSKGIKIVDDLDIDNNVEMYTNEIVQVFLNIIKNSHDNFVERDIEDAKIFINTRNTSSGIFIEIIDNGGGIDKKYINKIFDPYFSTKKEINGTGLGLYMSKIIVEEHHFGRIYVENRGTGVCFSIELNKNINKE